MSKSVHALRNAGVGDVPVIHGRLLSINEKIPAVISLTANDCTVVTLRSGPAPVLAAPTWSPSPHVLWIAPPRKI